MWATPCVRVCGECGHPGHAPCRVRACQPCPRLPRTLGKLRSGSWSRCLCRAPCALAGGCLPHHCPWAYAPPRRLAAAAPCGGHRACIVHCQFVALHVAQTTTSHHAWLCGGSAAELLAQAAHCIDACLDACQLTHRAMQSDDRGRLHVRPAMLLCFYAESYAERYAFMQRAMLHSAA